jgi:hypothetical protein
VSYNGYADDKQWGANLALMVAFQHKWFDGYDWVIRINPDVLIRDSTFLQTHINDPNVDAILHKCRQPSCQDGTDNPERTPQPFKYLQIHTDVLVFRPDAPLLWGKQQQRRRHSHVLNGDGTNDWKTSDNRINNDVEVEDVDVDVPFSRMEPAIGELPLDDEFGRHGGINAYLLRAAANAAANTTAGGGDDGNANMSARYDIDVSSLIVGFNHELTASRYFHSIVRAGRHRWWEGIPPSNGLCRVGHNENVVPTTTASDSSGHDRSSSNTGRSRSPVVHDHSTVLQCRGGRVRSCTALDGYDII